MVGLNSFALREFGKEPNRMQPPPPFPGDFTYQFNEPFPDFDFIDDWIIEPDSTFASMEGNCTQEPLLASSQGTHQPSEPEEGLRSKERPQCSDGSDLVTTEFQVSQVKHEPARHSSDRLIESDSPFASMKENCLQEPLLAACQGTYQPSQMEGSPCSKFDERPQCSDGSDLVTTGFQVSQVEPTRHSNDWIIEPASTFVPMEGNCMLEPPIASSQGIQGLSKPKDSPHSKFNEQPQCSDGSDSVTTKFQVSQVKHEPARHSNGYHSGKLVLEISAELGASSSISIAEEMGKVSLGGDSRALDTSSARDGPTRIDGVTGEAKLNEVVNMDSRVIDKTTAIEDPTEREETEAECHEVSEFSDNDSSSRSEDETDSDGSEEEEEEEEEDDDDDGDDSGDDGRKTQRKIDDDGEFEEGEIRDFDQEDIVLSSEDEEGGVSKGPVKSKNEIEELPNVPRVNVVLQPHHQMLPVGLVSSIIGTKVIVEGLEKHNPLNEGSIMWITATRSPLGVVDEIFGPVKNPYYIVRFNSEEEVPAGIREGTAISFVVEFANHVLNDRSLYQKGYDASGENDEEIHEEAEFSDDEKEAEYRRSLRMAKKGKDRPGNREFEGRKKAQLKVRSGYQGFEGQNKAQIHKNIRHTSSLTPGVGPPAQDMGMPFVPIHLQERPVLCLSGCGSCECSFGSGQVGICGPTCASQASHMAEQATSLGGHVWQPNPGWVNGIPAQQHHGGSLNCFQMNLMPHLPGVGSSNGLTGNQHFDPSYLPLLAMPSPCGQLAPMLMNLPGSNGLASNQPFGPSQLPLPAAMQLQCGQLGSMPMNLPGFVSNGSFNQVPFGMGIQSQGTAAFQPHNRPFPSAPSHGGSSESQQFNPGVASNHVGFSAPQQFNPGAASNHGGFSSPQQFNPGAASNHGGFSAPQQFNPGAASNHGGFSSPQQFNPGAASNHGGFSAPQQLNPGAALNHGGFSAPQKFSPVVASNRRRKVFPRGGQSNSSRSRGWRPTAQ